MTRMTHREMGVPHPMPHLVAITGYDGERYKIMLAFGNDATDLDKRKREQAQEGGGGKEEEEKKKKKKKKEDKNTPFSKAKSQVLAA